MTLKIPQQTVTARRDAKPRPRQTLLGYDRHGDPVVEDLSDHPGATVLPLFERAHIARSR